MSERCVRHEEMEAALDARLESPAREAMMVHAETCVRCRAVRIEHEALSATLGSLGRPAMDEVAAKRLRASVLSKALQPETTARGWRMPVLVAAAAALLMVVGVRAWRSSETAASTTTATLPIEAGAVALGGSGYMVRAEGAEVVVERAGADTRVRVVEGGATFVVQRRRAGERFVVVTDDAEVEVRGTRFVVEAARQHLRAVRVLEGRVAVRRQGAAERMLTRGESVEIARVVEVVQPAPAVPVVQPTVVQPTVTVARVQPRATVAVVRVQPRVVQLRVVARRDFRDGTMAFVRHEDGAAVAALGRFLATARAGDARREDARYVRVLAFQRMGDDEARQREAEAYLREFPSGLRRAEVMRLR